MVTNEDLQNPSTGSRLQAGQGKGNKFAETCNQMLIITVAPRIVSSSFEYLFWNLKWLYFGSTIQHLHCSIKSTQSAILHMNGLFTQRIEQQLKRGQKVFLMWEKIVFMGTCCMLKIRGCVHVSVKAGSRAVRAHPPVCGAVGLLIGSRGLLQHSITSQNMKTQN